MKLAIAICGLLLAALWLAERQLQRRSRRFRERDRKREEESLRHITGARRWWREPPGDGPEGDL
jgi:FtsZ-interacting cell division protein ZipA